MLADKRHLSNKFRSDPKAFQEVLEYSTKFLNSDPLSQGFNKLLDSFQSMRSQEEILSDSAWELPKKENPTPVDLKQLIPAPKSVIQEQVSEPKLPASNPEKKVFAENKQKAKTVATKDMPLQTTATPHKPDQSETKIKKMIDVFETESKPKKTTETKSIHEKPKFKQKIEIIKKEATKKDIDTNKAIKKKPAVKKPVKPKQANIPPTKQTKPEAPDLRVKDGDTLNQKYLERQQNLQRTLDQQKGNLT